MTIDNANSILTYSIVLNDGIKTKYTYDGIGRLESVTIDGLGKIGSYSYGLGNQSNYIESTTYLSAVSSNTTTELYDNLGRIYATMNSATGLSQHTGYYPYGEPWSEPSGQPYLYGGKERLREGGLNEYDFGARRYNSALALWTTPDPVVHDQTSPYTYCAANPIKFIDPSGCELVFNGDDIKTLIETLNRALKTITISTGENGKVSYIKNDSNDQKASTYDEMMSNIIDDENITVYATAQKSSNLENGQYVVGGAFMGNDYDETNDKVKAKQTLVPSALNTLSKDNTGQEGQDIMHELTEAYVGGQISLANKKSSPAAGKEGSVYQEAHNKAVPQSGDVLYEEVRTNTVRLNQKSDGTLKLEWLHRGTFKTIKGNILHKINGYK